jgi:hypothetical protein
MGFSHFDSLGQPRRDRNVTGATFSGLEHPECRVKKGALYEFRAYDFEQIRYPLYSETMELLEPQDLSGEILLSLAEQLFTARLPEGYSDNWRNIFFKCLFQEKVTFVFLGYKGEDSFVGRAEELFKSNLRELSDGLL